MFGHHDSRLSKRPSRTLRENVGADDGTRTRDPHLGKVMLYQLSHIREDAEHQRHSQVLSPGISGAQILVCAAELLNQFNPCGCENLFSHPHVLYWWAILGSNQ